MERLTKRDKFGNADIIGVDSMDLQLNLDFGGLNKVTEALNKLARYEDLEEQGLLLQLPRKLKPKKAMKRKEKRNGGEIYKK